MDGMTHKYSQLQWYYSSFISFLLFLTLPTDPFCFSVFSFLPQVLSFEVESWTNEDEENFEEVQVLFHFFLILSFLVSSFLD